MYKKINGAEKMFEPQAGSSGANTLSQNDYIAPGNHSEFNANQTFASYQSKETEESLLQKRFRNFPQGEVSPQSPREKLAQLLTDETYTIKLSTKPQETLSVFADLSANEEILAQTRARIFALEEIAREEGILVSPSSEQDLLAFLRSRPFGRRPYLALLDNGNFRALWDNETREQIAIQFFGARKANFVLFVKRDEQDMLASYAGHDTLANIFKLIDNTHLWRLTEK